MGRDKQRGLRERSLGEVQSRLDCLASIDAFSEGWLPAAQ
jgi:hypothetical protein